MLSFLALLGCATSGSVSLPLPSEVVDVPADVMPLEQALATRRDFAKLELARIDFPEVDGFKVRMACAAALKGVRVSSVLDEDACGQVDEMFASKNLDADKYWARALDMLARSADISPSEDDGWSGLRVLKMKSGDVANSDAVAAAATRSRLHLMALAERRLKTAAVARVAGVEADLWGCVKDMATVYAEVLADAAKVGCASASSPPSPESLESKLAELAAKREAAQKLLASGTRAGKVTWSPAGACTGLRGTVHADLPLETALTFDGGVATVISVLKGEKVSITLTSMDSDPLFEVWDASCSLVRARVDDSYGYGRGAHHELDIDESGSLVIVSRSLSGMGSGNLRVETDGAGGPSGEERADAQAYIDWYDSQFPGIDAQALQKSWRYVAEKLGDKQSVLVDMVRADQNGEGCLAQAALSDAVVRVALVESGMKECSGMIDEAVSASTKLRSRD